MQKFAQFMKKVFGWIFKFLSYIFISLGLWLPAVYSIVYFVVVGSTSATFAGGVKIGYFVGLGITGVGGIVLAMMMKNRRENRAEGGESAPKPLKKKKKRGEEESETQPVQPPQPQYIPYPYPQYYPVANPYDMPQNYAQTQTAAPQNNAPVTSHQPDNPDLLSYHPVQTLSPEPASNEHAKPESEIVRTKINDDQSEKPMVFRTRRDPNVFVCEYSNRYEYWRRTHSGVQLEHTEYKGAGAYDGSRRR